MKQETKKKNKKKAKPNEKKLEYIFFFKKKDKKKVRIKKATKITEEDSKKNEGIIRKKEALIPIKTSPLVENSLKYKMLKARRELFQKPRKALLEPKYTILDNAIVRQNKKILIFKNKSPNSQENNFFKKSNPLQSKIAPTFLKKNIIQGKNNITNNISKKVEKNNPNLSSIFYTPPNSLSKINKSFEKEQSKMAHQIHSSIKKDLLTEIENIKYQQELNEQNKIDNFILNAKYIQYN